jgi:hypothetical protein
MLQLKTRKAGMVLHYLLLGNTVWMYGKKWKINKRGYLCTYDAAGECYIEENMWFHKFMQYCDDLGTEEWLKIVRAVKDSETENLHVFREKKAV